MIRFLSIRHLAVIDALDVEFGPGLTVLTGETGAGKSMLVEALGLLVGGRASPDLVRTGEAAATVQAVIEPPEGGELVVRREVSGQGRSRAFVNDTLVTTAALRERCGPLVDLHGQHEHQRLLDPSTHLDLVDLYAGLSERRAEVARRFAALREARQARDRLRVDEEEKARRVDWLAFQLAEIDRIEPRPGEDEALAATKQLLANAERLQRLCSDAYTALYEGDHAVLAGLGLVWRRLDELQSLDARFAPYLDGRDSIKAQLEELAYFLRGYVATLDASPERLQEVEDRLARLERLKRKYGPTLADVLARQAAMRAELESLQTVGERLAEAEAALAAARTEYLAAAEALSAARRAAAVGFARALEAAVAELAMPKTRCEVRFAPGDREDAWSDRGIDEAELYLSPNPGEDLRPLVRIASGGELSRLMLALKTLAPTDAPGKTLVFDEVDAGIGGGVADVVGRKLRQLGDRYQVLCITHLPQIAAYGAHHYRIDKTVEGGRTLTRVRRLDPDERTAEIARMIGGRHVTESVLASARDLLARAESSGGEEKANMPRSPRPRARKSSFA
jgi:DNA repair protein RecN (Recombination protein N)